MSVLFLSHVVLSASLSNSFFLFHLTFFSKYWVCSTWKRICHFGFTYFLSQDITGMHKHTQNRANIRASWGQRPCLIYIYPYFPEKRVTHCWNSRNVDKGMNVYLYAVMGRVQNWDPDISSGWNLEFPLDQAIHSLGLIFPVGKWEDQIIYYFWIFIAFLNR